MEEEQEQTVSVPIVPVSLHQFSNKADVRVPMRGGITGGILKEKVGDLFGTPKNRQIVVVLNSERTLVERIIHEETPLSAPELASVCILECIEPVKVQVQVRWPRSSEKRADGSMRKTTYHLCMSPDSHVSTIREEVEKENNLVIEDWTLSFNGEDIEHKDENKTLSFYHISSNSKVKLSVFECSYPDHLSWSLHLSGILHTTYVAYINAMSTFFRVLMLLCYSQPYRNRW